MIMIIILCIIHTVSHNYHSNIGTEHKISRNNEAYNLISLHLFFHSLTLSLQQLPNFLNYNFFLFFTYFND